MSTRSTSVSILSGQSTPTAEKQPKIEEALDPLIPAPLELLNTTSAVEPLVPRADPATKNTTKQAITNVLQAQAWPVHKRPLTRFIVQSSQVPSALGPKSRQKRLRLILPRSYRGVGGSDSVNVSVGDDLNYAVYKWYSERTDPMSVSSDKKTNQPTKGKGKVVEQSTEVRAAPQMVNYVTRHEIMARRHEYLGPDPRVAGYRFSTRGDEVSIRWWDHFLKDAWSGKESWSVELEDVNGVWQEVA